MPPSDINNNNNHSHNREDLLLAEKEKFLFEKNEHAEKVTTVKSEHKFQLVWRNIGAMLFLHGGLLYTLFEVLPDPRIKFAHVLVIDILAHIAILGITAGSHRLWAHRSYKAKLPLRIFLMILNTMSLQDDIYQWSRDHRLHHKYSDTDADPYNASRGFFFSHIGWLMVRKHPEVVRVGKNIPLDDLYRDPVVRFQRRFYIPLVVIFWGLVPTFGLQYLSGLPLHYCFFGGVVSRYLLQLHLTWTINSVAHLWGYQFYDTKLEPRENWIIRYVSQGEGYHNYHHAFPWDYRAAEMNWQQQFNITGLFIDACAALGLAYDLRIGEKEMVRKRIERTGDLKQREKYFSLSPSNPVLEMLLGLAMTLFFSTTYFTVMVLKMAVSYVF